ncbi:hypothetical protein [Gaoshiqia sp. Z1-71]|uniref:hypothetical protein n=1 Tax=Gaoshiqia hydrogeniformans TaxID=3290090 RepID=UPI003BF91770
MKQFVSILVFILLGFGSFSQSRLATEFQKSLKLTQQAWDYSQQVAGYFSLYNGAADLEEIKYHSFDALTGMDSLYVYAKKAEFQATDASYSAKEFNQPAISRQAEQAAGYLRLAGQSLLETQNKLNLIFDETVYSSVAIQINQALDLFSDTRKQLKMAERELKLAIKSIGN